MSPARESVVIAGDSFSLRHIGPRADVWPDSPAADITVLGRTDMVARPLPSSNLPSSPDFVSGSYTLRLGDSGEAMLTFPNTVASDGIPWRQRFSPAGHLQFIEIYRNGELEFVGVIDQIPRLDQQQVQVHCSDGWFLLKKGYVRDWITIQAPRDVIERGTQLWVPTVLDDFQLPNSTYAYVNGTGTQTGSIVTPYTTWTASATATNGAAEVYSNPGAGVSLLANLTIDGGTNNSTAQISSPVVSQTASVWRYTATLASLTLSGSGSIGIQVVESGSGQSYQLALTSTSVISYLGSSQIGSVAIRGTARYALSIESDGEWVWAFVDGGLVSCIRRSQTTTTSLQAVALATCKASTGNSARGSVLSCVLETLQPFVQ